MNITAEHSDLINDFIHHHGTEFSREIRDEDMIGKHYFSDIEDMVEDGYNKRGWEFLRDYMTFFDLTDPFDILYVV